MYQLYQKIIRNKKLQNFIVKHYPGVIRRYVQGGTLEELIPLLQKTMADGYSSILHPLQLHRRETSPYLEAVHVIQSYDLKASLSLRLPLEGNLDDLISQASRAKIRIEIDMREEATIDKTIDCYKRIQRQNLNTVLCLQANLRRTEQDIASLLECNPHIRLVKGAFKGTKEIAYTKKKDIDRNYLQLAQQLLICKEAKLALATHDEDIIAACLAFAEINNIPKEKLEFQMIYGVKLELQEKLNLEGFAVGKYIVYGEDWLPYLISRLWERKEYILPIILGVLRK